MASSPQEISRLLVAWGNGDQAAVEQLMPLVYGGLRRMARRYMAGQPQGHTLQTTALIHEAYLKMVGWEDQRFQNRAHFFGVAAQAMCHILVDYARARHAAKRGGDAPTIALDEATLVSTDQAGEMVALDNRLNELAPRRMSLWVRVRTLLHGSRKLTRNGTALWSIYWSTRPSTLCATSPASMTCSAAWPFLIDASNLLARWRE
jgi:RNA polymerase sigma factor (TIGR02999 family)